MTSTGNGPGQRLLNFAHSISELIYKVVPFCITLHLYMYVIGSVVASDVSLNIGLTVLGLASRRVYETYITQ